MTAKELEELASYHDQMLKYAQGHVAHHTKMAQHYRDRRKKLKNEVNTKISKELTGDILKKLMK